jgi:hypothetical protein
MTPSPVTSPVRTSLASPRPRRNGVGHRHRCPGCHEASRLIRASRYADLYHVDATTIAGGFSGLPTGAVIDTWIADAGYLVILEAKG